MVRSVQKQLQWVLEATRLNVVESESMGGVEERFAIVTNVARGKAWLDW